MVSLTKTKGEATEAIILARIIENGLSVSLPFGDNQRYDMIVDEGGTLLKAQCKSGRLHDGVIDFNTCSNNGFNNNKRDYRGQVDVFLVYCYDNRMLYKVPVEDVGLVEGRLRVISTKNNQQNGIRWAKNYEYLEPVSLVET